MSKIEQLLKKLCPNGVEYKPLWSVTYWDKKFNAVDREKQPKIIKYNYLLANDLKPLMVDGGTVKLLTTSSTNLFTTEEKAGELISEGEVVTIPWGGNPNVQYYKGKFLTADNRIATSRDTKVLDNKYLYYFMESSKELIGSFYRGSGIKHPDMVKVLDLLIPVPPLEIQREVVEVLDKFALLTAELTAELEKRKKQYEHYRDKLLNFTGGGTFEWLTLGGIVEVLRGKRLTKSMLSSEYQYPVFHGGLDPLGYFNKANRPSETVMIINVGASAGTVGYCEKEFWSSDGCFCLSHTDVVKSKFLYYLLQGREGELKSRVRVAGIPTLDRQNVENMRIPLPPLAEQERIVKILDRFDKLCNDLTSGLPAEIAARKKQYEYYRDKLLSFKRAG